MLTPELIREQRALIALSLVPGIGPGRIRALMARFGSAQAVFEASIARLARVDQIGPQTARAIHHFDDETAVEEQIQYATQSNAMLLPNWHTDFPALLRHIYDPPAFLWIRGRMVPEDGRAVAIVGTRRASDYGKHMAYSFAADLARQGFTVVSGLAYGIDTAAHKGALDAGGRTLAVLGSGVDTIYPRTNAALARRIIKQGALISEYPLQAQPDAPHFPRRNRIISGMSLGTLVAEAYEEGGALITARMALEQNREVFAIPSALSSQSRPGCNRLIQAGHAQLVTCVADILNELNLPQAPDPPPTLTEPLHPIEQKLFDTLGSSPVQIDELCARTRLDTSTALVYLLSLEFKGLVRQMAGKQFVRL